MNSEKTQRIQKKVLSIYKEIKKICDKENIHYYAISGTALGAIRHKGFIPWDDDIDLGIPINELEKFKSACKKHLPKNLEFKELSWAGGKVHDKNTTFLETTCLMNRSSGSGIFVDIFPLIGTPNNPKEREIFLSEMKKFNGLALVSDRYPEISKFTPKEIQTWKKKLLYKYDIKNSDQLVEFSFGDYYTFDAQGTHNSIEVQFEDTIIPISSSYDNDLRNHYGDYMKLPPKEKRTTHNKYAIIDFKNPYTQYYTQLETIDPNLLNLLHDKHNLEGIFFDGFSFLKAENQSLLKEKLSLSKENQSLLKEKHELKQDYLNLLEQYNIFKKHPLKTSFESLLKKIFIKLR